MKKYEVQYLKFYDEEIIKKFEDFDNSFIDFFDTSESDKLKSEDNESIVKISFWVRDYITHISGLTNRCNQIFELWTKETTDFMAKLYEERPYLKYPQDFAQFDPSLGEFDSYYSFDDETNKYLQGIFDFENYMHSKFKELEILIALKTEDLILSKSYKLMPYSSFITPKLLSLESSLPSETNHHLLESFIQSMDCNSKALKEKISNTKRKINVNDISDSVNLDFQNIFNDKTGKAFELFEEFLNNMRNGRKDGQFKSSDVGFIVYVLREKEIYLPKSFNHFELSKFMETYCEKVNNEQLKFSKDSIRKRSDKQNDVYKKLYNKYKDNLNISL
jgi:hypothetical protein